MKKTIKANDRHGTETLQKGCRLQISDFKCNEWSSHDKLGHAREMTFQHPIKVYFGAKCGGCKELQSFKVYKNSHLVIQTSQEVSDVPYADCFRVEAVMKSTRRQLERELLLEDITRVEDLPSYSLLTI